MNTHITRHTSEEDRISLKMEGCNTPHIFEMSNSDCRFYDYHPIGNIVYAVNRGGVLASIDYHKWDPSLGTPVGIVCIPRDFLPDKKARMISPWWVDAEGKDSDGPGGGIAFSISGSHDRPTRSSIITWNNTYPATYGSSTTMTYYSTDIVISNKCASDPQTGYQNNPFAISAYNKDGKLNYDVLKNNTALADFDGKGNTAAMTDSVYAAAHACSLHTTLGTTAGDWYLPSVGEWNIAIAREAILNSAQGKFGVKLNNAIWTSTAHSGTGAWMLYADIYAFFVPYIGNGYGVRPMCHIPDYVVL